MSEIRRAVRVACLQGQSSRNVPTVGHRGTLVPTLATLYTNDLLEGLVEMGMGMRSLHPLWTARCNSQTSLVVSAPLPRSLLHAACCMLYAITIIILHQLWHLVFFLPTSPLMFFPLSVLIHQDRTDAVYLRAAGNITNRYKVAPPRPRCTGPPGSTTRGR